MQVDIYELLIYYNPFIKVTGYILQISWPNDKQNNIWGSLFALLYNKKR